MQPLNGSDLQAAYQVAQPRAALWSEFSVPVKIAYEQTAQALNVKLGLTEASAVEYLFVFEDSVTQASDIRGIKTLIDINLEPADEFEVVIIRAGHVIGSGEYQMLKERNIWESKWEGEAKGLAMQFAETESHTQS